MRLAIPRGLRYWVVNLLEGNTSATMAWAVRGLILVSLILMAAPWQVAREVAYGLPRQSPDLKSALRAMLWVWNRSWIPFRFKLGTFFDIGWYLSAESCQALARRRFLSRDPLKRPCDLAQLKLATIKDGAQSQDRTRLLQADEEIRSLVSGVLSDAYRRAGADTGVAAEAEPLAAQPGPAAHGGQRFDNDRTRSALLDFDDVCRALGLRYFLVSGTFLGVVRDGAFIGHDHDIDVGVFEQDLTEALIPALSHSDRFVVNQVDTLCLRQASDDTVRYAFMAKSAIIRLAHRSGISIDIFTHFHDGDLVWHGSSVHRWNNTRFDLKDYAFLGRSFKGAVDFDRYLTENYGPDWRIPKRDFNVNLDTPNLSFAGTANALVYFCWMAANAVADKQFLRARKYIAMLAALGAVEVHDGLVRVR